MLLLYIVDEDRVLESADFILRSSLRGNDTCVVSDFGFDGFRAFFHCNRWWIKCGAIGYVLKTG